MNFGDTSDGADAEAGEILAYDSLTCKQLQERLVDLGLKKSGKKSELVARLMAADLKDKELAAAGTVGDEEVEADEDVADEVEVEAAVDDIEDELVGRIDWSNLTDSELRRLCELWHVKGRFTRLRAIRQLEALHERGEGCVCEVLGPTDPCKCQSGIVSGSEASEGGDDEQADETETAMEQAEENVPTEDAGQTPGPALRRTRNSRWFTLETAESHRINYDYLVELQAYAEKQHWDVSLIQMIDQSTLELERYFGRTKEGAQGTPSMQQFLQADRKVRLDYHISRVNLLERWVQGNLPRGNISNVDSGADPSGQAGSAALGMLLRKSKSGRSVRRDAAAPSEDPFALQRAHAAQVQHDVKSEGLKQSLANTANKSSYNSSGACRLQMLPPGPYAMFKDLAPQRGEPALTGRRCAVYWKDKPAERTVTQQKACEKGRWWKATVTGVERAHNTLLLAVLYDARDDVESTDDRLDVRKEHVVWLLPDGGSAVDASTNADT